MYNKPLEEMFSKFKCIGLIVFVGPPNCLILAC